MVSVCIRGPPGLPLNQLVQTKSTNLKSYESAVGEKSETYVLPSFADLGF